MKRRTFVLAGIALLAFGGLAVAAQPTQSEISSKEQPAVAQKVEIRGVVEAVRLSKEGRFLTVRVAGTGKETRLMEVFCNGALPQSQGAKADRVEIGDTIAFQCELAAPAPKAKSRGNKRKLDSHTATLTAPPAAPAVPAEPEVPTTVVAPPAPSIEPVKFEVPVPAPAPSIEDVPPAPAFDVAPPVPLSDLDALFSEEPVSATNIEVLE